MSMSMNVIGIAASTDRHEKMIAIVKACEAGGVTPPAQVLAYFAATTEEYDGVTSENAEYELHREIPHREWKRDMSEGFEVDIAEMPPDVTTVRFYCSW